MLLVYFGQADGPLKNESLFMLLVPLSATVAGVLISFPCDYLSVIKSLALIKLAEAENKFQFYFVVDFSVSLMMGIAWFLFIAFILVTFGEYLKNFEVLWAFEGKAYLEVTTVLSVLSVAVTSLAPTLMLLVLTAAGYVARTAFRLTKPFDFLRRRVLHLDEKPFLSLGLLLAIPGYLFVLLILLAVG